MWYDWKTETLLPRIIWIESNLKIMLRTSRDHFRMSLDNSYPIAHFGPPLWRHERAWWKLEPQHTQHWRCSHVWGNWYSGVKVFWKTWNKVRVDVIWNTVCHEFLMMSCLILLLEIIDAVVDTSLTHVPSSLLPARSQSEPIPRWLLQRSALMIFWKYGF